jgi:type VI secretion system protein ImpA
MKREISIDVLLLPIPGENPGGADLRYSKEYDEIKDARRYDDPLDQGEWQTEPRKADWDRALGTCIDALSHKTKDLQIAAWLMEALILTEGFEGCAAGLKIMNGLLENFWESLYPPLEDDDLEYRIAPLEFMNEKLSSVLSNVPVTESGRTPGYSLLKWQESRQVGYETEVRDEEKRKRREEYIAEGKLTAEEFDSAIGVSSPGFYKSLYANLTSCTEEFRKLDSLVDEKFGREAPRLSIFGDALEETNRIVKKICKGKGLLAVSEAAAVSDEAPHDDHQEERFAGEDPAQPPVPSRPAAVSPVGCFTKGALVDTNPWEEALWAEALRTMKTGGVKRALEKLTEASLSAPSIREECRYKLYSAKLCMQAGRADLARPVLEQLHGLIEELHLERWESPVWIADVLGTLYQCLMSGQPSDEDLSRAQGLFQRICTIDMTKAAGFGGRPD